MVWVISEPERYHFASFYPYMVLKCSLLSASEGHLFKSQSLRKLFDALFSELSSLHKTGNPE